MTRADRACEFIQNLTLTDEFAGLPMVLHPWQENIIRRLNEVDPATGLQLIRRALLLLPRKSAKTTLCAQIALEHLLNTDVGGRVCLCAASDRYQAGHLFKKCQTIIEADPYLRRQCRIYTSSKRIETKTGNALQVMGSDAGRSHGENPSLVICDELHVWKTTKLFEGLTSAFGARTEYCTIMISTAGNKREGLLWDQVDYARKCLKDPSKDPTFLPIIYEAPPELDTFAESTWRIAMPALDSGFGNLEFIRQEFERAKEIPSELAKCEQLYLNRWVAGQGKWLNQTKWDLAGQFPVDPEQLRGRRCYVGADLSAKSDVSAVVLVFPMDTQPQTYEILPFFWIPKEYAKERDRKGFSTWQQHEKQGLVSLTKGFYIDDEEIVGKIIELSKVYQVKRVIFDDWNADRPATLVEAAGLKTNKIKGWNSNLHEPTKFLEYLIATEALHHGNNPILNVMAGNCVIDTDNRGYVRFDKQAVHDKIDGMTALCLGIAGAMVERPKKPSVYETRGLISIG